MYICMCVCIYVCVCVRVSTCVRSCLRVLCVDMDLAVYKVISLLI